MSNLCTCGHTKGLHQITNLGKVTHCSDCGCQLYVEAEVCANCGGSGKVHSHNDECWECEGSGIKGEAERRRAARKVQLTTNQALNEQLLAINKLLEAEPEGLSIARGVIDGKPFYKVERPIKVIHPKE